MKRLFAVMLTALVASTATAAPDLEKGKEIAETICVACHAADGNSGIAIYPRLAGQHAAYTAKHAKDIRNRVRTWSLTQTTIGSGSIRYRKQTLARRAISKGIQG